MRKLSFILFMLVGLSVLAANAKSVSSDNVMELKTVKGKKINIKITSEGFTFDQYKGKTVFLTFFGPMCPPCLLETPHLVEMQKDYKNKLQIVAIQVQMPMDNETMKDFMKQHKINYPVVNLNDAWDIITFIKANTNWGGQIPFLMVFDKYGKLKKSYMGLASKYKLLSNI